MNFGAMLFATPTRTFTLPPITVIITATPRPATKTATPPPTQKINSPTARPTQTATLSPTSTATLTQISGVPRATATFTAIPTPIPVPPPKLISPTDKEQVRGANKRIELKYQPAQPIRAQEFYRVQVDYLDRQGTPVSWCAFTQDSQVEFPREIFDDSSPAVRSFLWRVNVVRSNQFRPATCDAQYDVLSAPSDVWTFYWY